MTCRNRVEQVNRGTVQHNRYYVVHSNISCSTILSSFFWNTVSVVTVYILVFLLVMHPRFFNIYLRLYMAKLKFLILPTQGTLTMYCFLFSHFSISPFFKQRYSQRLSQPFNDCSSHFNDYPHFVFFIFSFVVLP